MIPVTGCNKSRIAHPEVTGYVPGYIFFHDAWKFSFQGGGRSALMQQEIGPGGETSVIGLPGEWECAIGHQYVEIEMRIFRPVLTDTGDRESLMSIRLKILAHGL